MIEYIRQRDEQQRRAGIRLHAVSKARRNDDNAGSQRHKGIEQRDTDSLASQTIGFIQVAAENFHGTDAKTQGKERMRHRRKQNIAETNLCDFAQIRHQIEHQTLTHIRQNQRMHGQYNHQAHQ